MKLADLRILIQEGESTTLEFKEGLSSSFAREMVALANTIGFIEMAGTGVKRIRNEAREGGYPEPEWETNGFTTVIFCPNPEVRAAADTGPTQDQLMGSVTPQVSHKYPISSLQVRSILEALIQPESAEALQRVAGLKDRVHFLRAYLQALIEQGWLEMTIPEMSRSSRQRYRLTQAGAE